MQEVSDDGGLLSCALNAVNAALTDAGIAMKHIFGKHSAIMMRCAKNFGLKTRMCNAAAANCCLGPDGQLLVDPDLQEEEVQFSGRLYIMKPSFYCRQSINSFCVYLAGCASYCHKCFHCQGTTSR